MNSITMIDYISGRLNLPREVGGIALLVGINYRDNESLISTPP